MAGTSPAMTIEKALLGIKKRPGKSPAVFPPRGPRCSPKGKPIATTKTFGVQAHGSQTALRGASVDVALQSTVKDVAMQ